MGISRLILTQFIIERQTMKNTITKLNVKCYQINAEIYADFIDDEPGFPSDDHLSFSVDISSDRFYKTTSEEAGSELKEELLDSCAKFKVDDSVIQDALLSLMIYVDPVTK